MSHEDIKKLSDAYLSIYKTEEEETIAEEAEQLDEARPLYTMTKRDVDKHLDSLENIHGNIMDSIIDSVPEDFPIRKRETLEKRLNAAYSKYFDMLDQQVKKVLEK